MESYTIKEARRSQKEIKSTTETRAERTNIVHYFSSYDLSETEGKALAMDYYIVRNDKEIIVQQNHLLAEARQRTWNSDNQSLKVSREMSRNSKRR